MKWPGRFRERILNAGVASVVTLLLGWTLSFRHLGHWLVERSYDMLYLVAPEEVSPSQVVIVKLDNGSPRLHDPEGGQWSRDQYTRLLYYLNKTQCRMVVFDAIFDRSKPGDDDRLATAIGKMGHVILAAQLETMNIEGAHGRKAQLPTPLLRKSAARIAIAGFPTDLNRMIRYQYSEKDLTNSLARVAAAYWCSLTGQSPLSPPEVLWLRYYGSYTSPRTIDSVDFKDRETLDEEFEAVFQRKPEFFKDKVVFVGGESGDVWLTPHSLWSGRGFPGVEIQATAFLNLINHDWFVRLSGAKEGLLMALVALVFGFGLSTVRPATGAAIAFVSAFLMIAISLSVIWQTHVWFAWLPMVAGQLPCAWLCSLWGCRRVPTTTVSEPAVVVADGSDGRADELVHDRPQPAVSDSRPSVPDHELIRGVGRGAYGEVWLARNAIGMFHAVKIAHRHEFKEPEPYEREFKGIRKFMPISRNHPGLVQVLHVGRNDERGYFYYVMELADDEASGQNFDPSTYAPRDLAKALKAHGRFSIGQCLEWFLPLADALHYLHEQQLIHRDIKPSNIIFVRDTPKLADIGLVTEAVQSGDATYIGTVGYIPPEGPGAPAADVYAFGKVIYEASTGEDRRSYPSLPAAVTDENEMRQLLELLEVVGKACQHNPRARYASMAAMRADLVRLQTKLKRANC